MIVGLVVATLAYANENPYIDAMRSGLEALGKSRTTEEFKSTSNQFLRIANAEGDKWHAFYYASYALVISAAMEPDAAKKDAALDEALEIIAKAKNLDADVSEAAAVEGFIYMLKIGVDPASRGQQYSAKSGGALGKAQKANPNNPRVLYLQAQLSYGTSQFFGTGIEQACALNNSALELFELDQPDHPLDPTWGKNQALSFQEQCSN